MTADLFRIGRSGIVLRAYQTEAHDETFRLFETVIGVLIRAATGTGKTLIGSTIAETWLRRSDFHRAMIVSPEKQLVWQFAEEIEEFIGITPGIEMADQSADPGAKIVVASRQSLLVAQPPTPEQVAAMAGYGITNLGSAPQPMIATCLRRLSKGCEVEYVQDYLDEINARPEACNGNWSRLHKFDPNLNWLIIFDEAHRHAYHLDSVRPIVDWFETNPAHRRIGLTATPKRSDGVSLGDKMFPAIALDYPLYHASQRCAVKDGYAVKYLQKYIEVEGVDFRSPHLVDPKSESGFDDVQLAIELEKRLASFVLPTLETVESRRCLIFSPTVDMARKVAEFINARRRCRCKCGITGWYTRSLLSSAAQCECGAVIGLDNLIDGDDDPARELDGGSPIEIRKRTYWEFRNNRFQYLSVCGLCREGFNDPDVSAMACFRPVSKKASALAEQMKGRVCRIGRELAGRLHEMPDADARLEAIAASLKPNALVVDLVGITGLGDCASTVEIYAQGKPDAVIRRAESILLRGRTGDVEEAIEQAEDEEAEHRRRIREERIAAERKAKEEAESRAKMQAEVDYSAHDIGFGDTDPQMATDKQYAYMKSLGMRIMGKVMSKGQAGRIIGQLKRRVPFEDVARTNHLSPDDWQPVSPSRKQIAFAIYKGVPTHLAKTPSELSLLIDAVIDPEKAGQRIADDIQKCRTLEDMEGPRADLRLVSRFLPKPLFDELGRIGKRRRAEIERPDKLPL